MTVWSALVVPVPMLALAVALDGPAAVGHALTHLTPAAIVSTLYTAWLASLFGYGVWNMLLARHPASAVVPFTMLVPVVGMLAAWWVVGERPNVAEAAGGALLLLGVGVTSGFIRLRRRVTVSDARP
jgi:O-acetylserine/cysteine efflux transporter